MPLPLLKIVQLTLTNRCQCHCEHCGVSGLRDAIGGELPLERIDAIFQDLRLAGCLVIDLFGGEPTLRPDLCQIISLAKSYGFAVSLESNGYLLDRDLMERLEAAGLDQIYLSLDDYRADRHDARRRKPGSFDRAVRALELGARSTMVTHVSVVPNSEEFFLSGDINRYLHFVQEHGAQMVRLLLPRFVGQSSRTGDTPLAAGGEQELFSHVAPQFHDFVYVHTPGTKLGETNACTAKHVFCHIMSNGWVAPCPYLPLVFGDATREPIVNIFERMQSHPLVRLGGDHCPMRNEAYIDAHIRPLGLDKPYHPIATYNLIDIGAPCPLACPDCSPATATARRPLAEIARELEQMAPEYRTVELYGGDAVLRPDLFEILALIPKDRGIILWSTCRSFPADPAFARQLASHPLRAIKVLAPLWNPPGTDATQMASELEQTVAGAATWGVLGIPIYLYVPMAGMAKVHDLVARVIPGTGIERVYGFSRGAPPLDNAAACFGRGLERIRLLWAHRGEQP